jgi:hypothetical protein
MMMTTQSHSEDMDMTTQLRDLLRECHSWIEQNTDDRYCATSACGELLDSILAALASRATSGGADAQDAAIWRHIAQERYADYRKERTPDERDYAIEGSLDALFNSYKTTGKFKSVFCSQCGAQFPANYHGYSSCDSHIASPSSPEVVAKEMKK